MTTEFKRVEQRQVYDSCMSHHNSSIPFMDVSYERAFKRGFEGFTSFYDIRGVQYAYWCAGRDKRNQMQQAA